MLTSALINTLFVVLVCVGALYTTVGIILIQRDRDVERRRRREEEEL